MFPRDITQSLSFSCNGIAAGRSQPWRIRARAWRDVRRTVIYATTKKYDNRRCQGRFEPIGDCLSMLVTRYRMQVKRLSFTLHYPKLKSLSILRGLFSGSVSFNRCYLYARSSTSLIALISVILINVTIAAKINYYHILLTFLHNIVMIFRTVIIFLKKSL